jgi:hypothetical protein
MRYTFGVRSDGHQLSIAVILKKRSVKAEPSELLRTCMAADHSAAILMVCSRLSQCERAGQSYY